jgi:dihydroneopterin aldolase
MSDAIRLWNVQVYGAHGVTEAERQIGRPFEVDVELVVDLATAGATDDIGATVDYAAVFELVRRVNESGPYRLLETFAEKIASSVLEAFRVRQVTVRVRKPNPPVGGLVGAAEVEITRPSAAGGRAND